MRTSFKGLQRVQGISGGDKGLQGVTRGDKGIQLVTKDCKE